MTKDVQSRILVFSVVSVGGVTAACATRGDVATVEELSRYYTLAASLVRPAEGTVVKVIGDGLIITFPGHRGHEAVQTLHALQQQATEQWQRFDSRCRVQVKVGYGPVIARALGPAGEERPDIYGDALNRLFKQAAADFVVMPELRSVLGTSA